jgi:hypothetical protein
MAIPSSVTIQYTHDAGVNKSVKDAANSMRIYDQFHVVTDGEPVSSRAIRSKVKVKATAGVLQLKPTKNFSIAFGR